MKIIGFKNISKLFLVILVILLILLISPTSQTMYELFILIAPSASPATWTSLTNLFVLTWSLLQHILMLSILISLLFTLSNIYAILQFSDKIARLDEHKKIEGLAIFIILVLTNIFLTNPKMFINNIAYRKKEKKRKREEDRGEGRKIER